MTLSMGKTFKELIVANSPLQVLGTINAYSAMLAQSAGARAIYLSGAGVANASYGLPDLGMTCLNDVLEDVRRVTNACQLPLLVDIDTGWGHIFNIGRTVKMMERAGVAAIHIEDQIFAKRCGHRPNKMIVPIEEMEMRIKAAVDARTDNDFIIMARTDAYSVYGLEAAIEYATRCVEAGADMVFPEALQTLEDYRLITDKIKVPILANITEFGKTPLFTREELKDVGVKVVLYPLSAFRAMSLAALNTYRAIIDEGTQQSVVDNMQTRHDLYEILHYHEFEKKLDELESHDDN